VSATEEMVGELVTLIRGTLAGLLEASASARPDGAAARDMSGAWTYAEVWSAVLAMSERLRASGVARGDLVVLTASRTVGAPVAMAAVIAVGAAYVPVDPNWPPARQQSVAEACRPVLVVAVDTETTLSGSLGTLRLRAADLMRSWPDTDRQFRASSESDGDALAYVIFTSGSTGRPKGVPITNNAAASLVTTVGRLVGLTEQARLIALSSFAFDISVFEIFGTWAAGAELVVADTEQIYPKRLRALLAGNRQTYTQTTPSVLSALLDSGLTVPSETVLLLAGERLPLTLLQRVGHVRQVWNLYGPTEATIYATAHACLPLPASTQADPPIGRPVAGAIVAIRPEQTESDTGELLIGGPGVAAGYLDEPALSAKAFITDSAGRWYRTGDIVTRGSDGTLTFRGRLDRQVKIRGNRVELDEVENVIAQLAGHTNVAVEAVDSGHLGTEVAAFVQATPGFDCDGLRERVAELLPAYMVPTRVHEIERLPMTSSGKIDRRALVRSARNRTLRASSTPRG
jgi:amino acid adenylation domain-containing protein